MKKYWSPSTKSFYMEISSIKPDDLVEITEALHTELLENQSHDASIETGVDGMPYSIFPDPISASDKLSRLKDIKKSRINFEAQKFINDNIPMYPNFEIQTFETQRREAIEWEADNATLTPNVNLIAIHRGMDREILLNKILINVIQYEQLAHIVVGQRQKLEDLVIVSTTETELDAIVISYT